MNPPFPRLQSLFMIALSLIGASQAKAAPLTEPALRHPSVVNLTPYEDYLNQLTQFEANIEQFDENGARAQGRLLLSRPGKFFIQYRYPHAFTMVSDGKWILYNDSTHGERSYNLLKETPAYFLVQPKISFRGDTQVSKVETLPNITRITLIQRENPELGSLILGFSKDPIRLVQWIVIDGQGNKTVVNLSGLKSVSHVNPTIFQFAPPQ